MNSYAFGSCGEPLGAYFTLKHTHHGVLQLGGEPVLFKSAEDALKVASAMPEGLRDFQIVEGLSVEVVTESET